MKFGDSPGVVISGMILLDSKILDDCTGDGDGSTLIDGVKLKVVEGNIGVDRDTVGLEEDIKMVDDGTAVVDGSRLVLVTDDFKDVVGDILVLEDAKTEDDTTGVLGDTALVDDDWMTGVAVEAKDVNVGVATILED